MSMNTSQSERRVGGLARMFSIRAGSLINTGALARWKDALRLGKLFQQFVNSREKPLKRLTSRSTSLHRAKTPVVMRSCWYAYGESGLEALTRTGAPASLPASRACMSPAGKDPGAAWRQSSSDAFTLIELLEDWRPGAPGSLP